MQKIINFLKYNNAAILILFLILLVGASVFAATDAGQAAIGQQTTRIEGVDNTVLLEADLEKLNFDFKIEKIEQDVEYYYITYTLMNLVKKDGAWQYELQEKNRKVTKKIKQDLGEYLAEEFKQEHDANIKELTAEQAKANAIGEQKREEVVEYTGLVGKTLDVVAQVFPNYEPVKRRELLSPDFSKSDFDNRSQTSTNNSAPDNLTDIYNSYITQNDPDHDDVFGLTDNCPMLYNPDQKDTDSDGVGDVCDIDQMGDNLPLPEGEYPKGEGVGATSTPVSGESAPSTDSAPAEPSIQPDIVIPPDTAEPAATAPDTI